MTGFLHEVRSGLRLDQAARYLAPVVRAHQLEGENPRSIDRTPAEYAQHVREIIADCGAFTLAIEELLVDGERAYARWIQLGTAAVGNQPQQVRQITSAVYRVRDGVIVEYWIQIDRLGIDRQTQLLSKPD